MKKLSYSLGGRIVAFSTERDTGCPEDPYDGFSVCFYTGDDPVHVALCRQELMQSVDGLHNVVVPRQTHSLNVAVIENVTEQYPDDVDALVTSLPGVALAVNTADCVPVLMADEETGIIAAVHSGWRGTVGHIVEKTLDVMAANGAVPWRVRAVMGPSICVGCFEVGQEVADEFEKSFPAVDLIVSKDSNGGRPHVDLRAAILQDLKRAGLNEDNIDMSAVPCSRCNSSTWWSARRHGVCSGRTLSLIMLKSN